MKKILFAVYTSPAGSIWINETFRSIFGMYGQDIEPVALLLNEAVLAVHTNCKPELCGVLPLSITFRYIEKYGTKVYAVKEDLERFDIKENEIDTHWNLQILSKSDLPEFLHSFDNVIFF
ncbi:DsrE family protein [Caldisericum exile]|uniref:Intracellular sulfur oxidation protein n=1 Tax=Caldisericum exile (strain DSM 21853 / NBRC 104410 / AZM16c01) TaxID=511051 RepID=A0A7U6JFK0_CALEA|nr:DsrE family protein [Caldisericum exile]BAL80524.1 hypothetical protein CSE_03980 [Caldisericum exile AZM16c01]